LSAPVFDPIFNKFSTFDISNGHVGFIAGPLQEKVLVALPTTANAAYGSLDELTRGKNGTTWTVVVINLPTFKAKFEIEM
jgi:hypothetical protein